MKNINKIDNSFHTHTQSCFPTFKTLVILQAPNQLSGSYVSQFVVYGDIWGLLHQSLFGKLSTKQKSQSLLSAMQNSFQLFVQLITIFWWCFIIILGPANYVLCIILAISLCKRASSMYCLYNLQRIVLRHTLHMLSRWLLFQMTMSLVNQVRKFICAKL